MHLPRPAQTVLAQALALACLLVGLAAPPPVLAQAVPVSVERDPDGAWRLLRGGQPYFIEGISGFEQYSTLRRLGANSVRLYGLGPDNAPKLDSAQANGMTILMGVAIPPAEALDYDDPTAVRRVFDNQMRWVRTYKDHPAVLGWVIGNEVVYGNSPDALLGLVDDLSRAIHAEDGKHPTLTVTAHINEATARRIAADAPDLDLLGVNSYGAINAVEPVLTRAEWAKPWIITEFGTNGPWESPRTTWGAPIERTSTEKRQQFVDRYASAVTAHPGRVLGSYGFLWDQKNEGSPTWFSLLFFGLVTEPVDGLAYRWMDETWPADRAPEVRDARLNGRRAAASVVLTSTDSNFVDFEAFDREGAIARYVYVVRPEGSTAGLAATADWALAGVPDVVEDLGGGRARLRFGAEENLREFRLFCFAIDAADKVAYAVIPFRVALEPEGNDPGRVLPLRDAYVRDGALAGAELGFVDRLNLRVKASDELGYTRQSLLAFPLGGLDADRLAAVTLRLRGRGPAGLTLEARATSGAWAEATVNWDNRPTVLPGALARYTTRGDSTQWYDFDLTEHIRERLRAGDTELSLAVVAAEASAGDPVSFLSREVVVDAPHLRLQFTSSVASVAPTEDEWRVFPNPVSNTLNVDLAERLRAPEATLSVYDLTGRLLVRAPATEVSLPVAQLAPGLHVLVYEGPAGRLARPVAKVD